MKLSIIQFGQAVRASYWFVPSVMVVLSILLGALMVWLDSGPLANLFEDMTWYQKSKPDGAREMLSSIASSAITVAGVAFSITIVAISFAANQYGPRILTNFMSDRGNQFTLGTFIATFVYCLMVLRTIYSGDTEFVPQLAVVVAMFLGLASTGMLIFFIHHVPESIHVNTVLASIGHQLIHSIDKKFPACVGNPPEQSEKERARFARSAATLFADGKNSIEIDCKKNGYLQAMDDDKILEAACEHDLVIRLERSPGDFLYHGQVIFLASPANKVGKEVRSMLRSAWSVGSKRTPTQDQMFLIDELIEIAARALSPGVNDPFTAITCMDWFSAAVAELAQRQIPSPYRADEEGKLRVVGPKDSFDLYIDRGFGRLRPYAARDVNAATHMFGQLQVLAKECRLPEQVEALSEQCESLFSLARKSNEGPSQNQIDDAATSARAAFARRISELENPDQKVAPEALQEG